MPALGYAEDDVIGFAPACVLSGPVVEEAPISFEIAVMQYWLRSLYSFYTNPIACGVGEPFDNASSKHLLLWADWESTSFVGFSRVL